jgi:hypothetical protein
VPGSSLSRRGVLLSTGALAAGLTGCDLRGTSSSPSAASTPDPDQAIVTAARGELSDLILRLGGATGASYLVAVHRVQLAALQGDPPPITTRTKPLSHRQVVAHERRALTRFTRWAEAAERGDLAQVLASIAAGIQVQPILRGEA